MGLLRYSSAHSASENYGNFYGQNLSPVQPGILLVFGVMAGLGVGVSVWSLVLYAIPIATISMILGAVQFWFLDRRYRKEALRQPESPLLSEPTLEAKDVSA